VLAWRVSISLAADAAVEALQESVARYGVPEIMRKLTRESTGELTHPRGIREMRYASPSGV
jgi:hypothetical protein